MIAYNHSIKFIPPLKNSKNLADSPSRTITIRENNTMIFDTKPAYKMIFTSNQGRDLAVYSDRPFARTVAKQQWTFDIEGVMTFFWNSGEFTIEYLKSEDFSPELLKYWALHIVLPLFLSIEEHFYFLHAGAVEIENAAVLFVAESFGGKSTMTDFFLNVKEHTMISDDKVAIFEEETRVLAVPSHPHHRPYRKREDLGLYVNNTSTEPKPILAIYELNRAEADASISIAEAEGIEKFKILRFSNEIRVSFLKKKNFKALGRLAEKVPVYYVTVPWDIQRLEEVYTTIVKHSHTLKQPS